MSLLIGVVSTAAGLALGVALGAAAGYAGGRIDDAVMRFTELFQTIPAFVLAMVLVAIFTPSIVSVIAAIALVSWPPVARMVRAEVLSLRSRKFVQAAQVLGRSSLATPLLIRRHRRATLRAWPNLSVAFLMAITASA